MSGAPSVVSLADLGRERVQLLVAHRDPRVGETLAQSILDIRDVTRGHICPGLRDDALDAVDVRCFVAAVFDRLIHGHASSCARWLGVTCTPGSMRRHLTGTTVEA